jgi:hypothetical protein
MELITDTKVIFEQFAVTKIQYQHVDSEDLPPISKQLPIRTDSVLIQTNPCLEDISQISVLILSTHLQLIPANVAPAEIMLVLSQRHTTHATPINLLHFIT